MSLPDDTPRLAVILAAGKGTRMKSSLPKVFHAVAGKPMIDWSIDLARRVGCDPIIVVCSPDQTALIEHVEHRLGAGSVALQTEQLGTGHAVKAAAQAAHRPGHRMVVLYGDTPLIQASSVESLMTSTDDDGVGVLGFEAANPGGYGRLICAPNGDLDRIVEAQDAEPDELAVTLCNSGVLAAESSRMFALLSRVTNENAKGEYYLTDIVALARSDGARNAVVVCGEADVLGVNSREQLAEANAAFQARRRREVMDAGVTLVAPETVFFAADTVIEPDVIIEPNIVFGPGVHVQTGAVLRAFSHIEGASIAAGAQIGPFARLRPGAEIGKDVRIGNFVEVKATRLEEGAKANHLAYLGDGYIGAGVNIGAGTIFCNYDGYDKHQTRIGASAFIGSNSALVAPVEIGPGAYVGSGSVITGDVSQDALALARAHQTEKQGWAVAYRAKKESPDGE